MSTKIVTGVCRSSYMFVNKLELRGDKATTPTIKTMILIPKKDKKTVKAIRAAIDEAAKAKFGKTFKEYSNKFIHPLRDGDKELAMREEDEDGEEGVEGEHYEGHYFINATQYRLVDLVDRKAVKVEDFEDREEMCASGSYFRFSVTAKGFDNESKGVRFVLNNIMFHKEGERLDGGVSGENEFADYASDAEDDDEIIPEKKKSKKKKKLKKKKRSD